MKFYTACALKGNKVLVRGYNNGVRFTDTVTYKPSLYMRTDTPSKYKTLTGVNVGRIKFENLYEAREFLDQYRELEDCPIYGNTDFITQYIMETIRKGSVNIWHAVGVYNKMPWIGANYG